jgi:hypothetical protein
MKDSCVMFMLLDVGSEQKFGILERVATSDGVRPRVCDTMYSSKRDAQKALDWKNRD